MPRRAGEGNRTLVYIPRGARKLFTIVKLTNKNIIEIGARSDLCPARPILNSDFPALATSSASERRGRLRIPALVTCHWPS